MAQITGIVEAQAAGKTYRLSFGFYALAELQKRFGADLAPIAALEDNSRMPEIATLLVLAEVGLKRFHPDATEADVEALLAEAPASLMEALTAAFPDQATAPVGTPSGKKKRRRGR